MTARFSITNEFKLRSLFIDLGNIFEVTLEALYYYILPQSIII